MFSGFRQSTNRRYEEASRSRSNESLSLSTVPHSMNLELVRLKAFKNLPSRSVSAIKLAKEGFYDIGEGDLVICFAFRLEKRGWRDGDVPREIHQKIVQKCPLLNGQSTNIAIGGSLNSQSGNLLHPYTEQINKTTETTRNHQQVNSEQVIETSEVKRNKQYSNSGEVYESLQRTRPQNVSNLQRTENGRQLDKTRVQSTVNQASGNVSKSPTFHSYHLVQASIRNTEISETLSSQNNQSTKSQSNPYHKRTRALQEQINAFLLNLNPKEINFELANYPKYAVLPTRVISF